MRGFILVWLIVGLVGAARSVLAEQDGKSNELVARAIQAVGGEAKLAKFNAQVWRTKGTYHGMGQPLPYEGKFSVQWPDQFKYEIVGVFTRAVNKDKGWVTANGETRDMSDKEWKQQANENYSGWVTTLLPLKDPAFQLFAPAEIAVEGQPALSVKVSRADRPDVTLVFAKDSGRLIQANYRGQAPEEDFKDADFEINFHNYKELEGVQIPMKIVIKKDGKLFVEEENLELQAVGKLDAAVFAKP